MVLNMTFWVADIEARRSSVLAGGKIEVLELLIARDGDDLAWLYCCTSSFRTHPFLPVSCMSAMSRFSSLRICRTLGTRRAGLVPGDAWDTLAGGIDSSISGSLVCGFEAQVLLGLASRRR